MRLIDADALIKYMCDHCGVSCNLEDECCSNVDAVENQPTVDAVPVVRCKDCDNRVYINMGDEIGVVGGCAIYKAALPADFYCAYGKRGE